MKQKPLHWNWTSQTNRRNRAQQKAQESESHLLIHSGFSKNTKLKGVMCLQRPLYRSGFGPVIATSVCVSLYEPDSVDLEGLAFRVSSILSSFYTICTSSFCWVPWDLRGWLWWRFRFPFRFREVCFKVLLTA